jgi:MFS family permease
MPLWAMLSPLSVVFALSHAFRTVATIVAGQIQNEFELSAEALGSFAAVFHLAFGAMQLVMGAALDRYGVRRTVGATFPLAVLGAAASACASSYSVLVAGQVLIGVGCAPAFLAVMVFVAERYPSDQFARISGLVLGAGGLGMLIIGTPLAWVVDNWSRRAGFVILAAASMAAWLATVLLVSDDPRIGRQDRETLAESFRRVGAIFMEKHTIGIVVLGATPMPPSSLYVAYGWCRC